jgi:hypothetical protein
MTRMSRSLMLLFFVVAAFPASADDWAKKMFTQTSHDFRTVGRGAKAEYYFYFTNPYKEEVRVASVRTSCGCTTPTVTQNLVKSKETAAVVAKLNTDTHIGDKSAVLTVVFDRPFYSEVQLNVRGHIRTDVLFTPAEVNFGEIVSGQTKQQEVVVTHTGGSNWEIRDVRSHCVDLLVSLQPAERSPGLVRYRMNVSTRGMLPEGDIRELLTLVTNDSRFPTIDMAVTGRVRPTLEVNPASLGLGTMKRGETVEKRLVIRAEQDFTIREVTCDDPRFRFEIPSGPKKLHFVKVFFAADEQAGAISRTITISTDYGAGKVTECLVSGTVVP